MTRKYEVVGELNDDVKSRLDRADDYDCYVDDSGDIVLISETPFADGSGLIELVND